MLAEQPLRRDAGRSARRYGDPLATQLRTMIALQDGARRCSCRWTCAFEKAADGASGVAVLQLVLVDARTTEFRLGAARCRSDPAPAFGPAVLTSLANHFADLVIAP